MGHQKREERGRNQSVLWVKSHVNSFCISLIISHHCRTRENKMVSKTGRMSHGQKRIRGGLKKVMPKVQQENLQTADQRREIFL